MRICDICKKEIPPTFAVYRLEKEYGFDDIKEVCTDCWEKANRIKEDEVRKAWGTIREKVCRLVKLPSPRKHSELATGKFLLSDASLKEALKISPNVYNVSVHDIPLRIEGFECYEVVRLLNGMPIESQLSAKCENLSFPVLSENDPDTIVHKYLSGSHHIVYFNQGLIQWALKRVACSEYTYTVNDNLVVFNTIRLVVAAVFNVKFLLEFLGKKFVRISKNVNCCRQSYGV